MANRKGPPGREEHLRLAGIVKDLHADLRRKFKLNENTAEDIWKEHCQNASALEQYADAMHHLATDHWSKLPETRIDWCKHIATEYFFHGGLQKALEKEERKKQRQKEKEKRDEDSQRDKEEKKILPLLTPSSKDTDSSERNSHQCKLKTETNDSFGQLFCVDKKQQEHIAVMLPLTEQIRLLDVGSCFNAFAEFEEFIAIGVDISPAVPSVFKCDFLNLKIEEKCNIGTKTLVSYLKNLVNPIGALPKESFHTVVFSLLLEYLPSPHQRYVCCLKAHDLLMVNGLLLIVTPDSHKQHRNAPMMKSWKKVIESLGFVRLTYVKKEHIHCMAFRKVVREDIDMPSDVSPEMLYIPQDFHGLEDEEDRDNFDYTESDEEFFKDSVNELPSFIDL